VKETEERGQGPTMGCRAIDDDDDDDDTTTTTTNNNNKTPWP
jgi:hypothetical protein